MQQNANTIFVTIFSAMLTNMVCDIFLYENKNKMISKSKGVLLLLDRSKIRRTTEMILEILFWCFAHDSFNKNTCFNLNVSFQAFLNLFMNKPFFLLIYDDLLLWQNANIIKEDFFRTTKKSTRPFLIVGWRAGH